MISIIVAVARNGVIGDRNRLIWHISEDLRRFKAITTGHPVIMGRKTFESLGRPLPNRINVVVTRQTGYRAEGCVVAGSLEDAIRRFDPSEEIFVIGGAQIYAQALPLTKAIPFSRRGIRPIGRRYARNVANAAKSSNILSFFWITSAVRFPAFRMPVRTEHWNPGLPCPDFSCCAK